MSDPDRDRDVPARSERDADAAWLLARERGDEAAPPSAATEARYAELAALLAALPAVPADISPGSHWRTRVLETLDAEHARAEEPGDGAAPARRAPRSHRRRVFAAGGALAAAAVLALILGVGRRSGRGAEGEPRLEVELASSARPLEHRPSRGAGLDLIVRGSLAGTGEVRVYDGHGAEVARCAAPGPSCTIEQDGVRRTIRLQLTPRGPGTLRAVLFTAPLGEGAAAGLDADLAAAQRAGISYITREPTSIY